MTPALLTQLLLATGLLALGIFIYRYGRFSDWRATYQGRTLMTQKCSWFLLVSHFLLESIWAYPAHDIIELIILTLVVGLFWATLLGLLSAQESVRPVSRKKGTGYVDAADLEKTRPRLR